MEFESLSAVICVDWGQSPRHQVMLDAKPENAGRVVGCPQAYLDRDDVPFTCPGRMRQTACRGF